MLIYITVFTLFYFITISHMYILCSLRLAFAISNQNARSQYLHSVLYTDRCQIPVFIIVQFENFFMNNIKNCHKLRIVINEVHYKRINCLSVSFSSINDLYLITVLYYTLQYLIPTLYLILKATIHGISVIRSCWQLVVHHCCCLSSQYIYNFFHKKKP